MKFYLLHLNKSQKDCEAYIVMLICAYILKTSWKVREYCVCTRVVSYQNDRTSERSERVRFLIQNNERVIHRTTFSMWYFVYYLHTEVWLTRQEIWYMMIRGSWFEVSLFLRKRNDTRRLVGFRRFTNKKITSQPFMVSKISVYNKIKYSPSHTGRVLTRYIVVVMHSWVTHLSYTAKM